MKVILALAMSFFFQEFYLNPRILYTSKDIYSPTPTDSVAWIKSSEFGATVVKYKNGERKRLYNSKVWGYISNKTIFRFYNEKTFEVTKLGNNIYYLRRESRVIGRNMYRNSNIEYTSFGLDGDIKPTGKIY